MKNKIRIYHFIAKLYLGKFVSVTRNISIFSIFILIELLASLILFTYGKHTGEINPTGMFILKALIFKAALEVAFLLRIISFMPGESYLPLEDIFLPYVKVLKFQYNEHNDCYAIVFVNDGFMPVRRYLNTELYMSIDTHDYAGFKSAENAFTHFFEIYYTKQKSKNRGLILSDEYVSNMMDNKCIYDSLKGD